MTLVDSLGNSGELVFVVSGKEIKDIKTEGGKSQSQRLRSVLFVYWKQLTEENKTKVSFESFYADKTENIIGMIKSKLI